MDRPYKGETVSLANFFGFGTSIEGTSNFLPDIFPIGMLQIDFVSIDIENTYVKILTDVVERTDGLSEDLFPVLWDNCLQSESTFGLISLLSKAMAWRQHLFLVYNPSLNLLRKATSEEAAQIEADYLKSGQSAAGVFISFKNHQKADMIRLYSALEYHTVSALNKSMNLSKAVQFKVSDLRSSTGLSDSAEAKAQGRSLAEALARGKDVMLDAKDIIETAKPDLTAVQAAIDFLDCRRAFYLGMPSSYINGEQTPGIGSTGEADTKAIERGLKNYYFSIIKPVIEALFDIKTTFKSQDFRQLDGALNALKTFDLISDEFISPENKLLIINKLLDLDSELGQPPPPQPVVVNPVVPNGKAPAPNA